ncbi:MAG: tetratricopeptide repeat protein [Candidatus Promineifilaceae bacterium]
MKDAIKGAYKLARQHCRQPVWGKLESCALAAHPLVDACLLDGDTDRGEAVLVLLAWIAERLRPDAPLNWGGYAWRFHLILSHYYLQGVTVREMTDRFGISEPAFYKSARKALGAAHMILEQGGSGQKPIALDRRLRSLSSEQRETVLRLSVLHEAISLPDWTKRDWGVLVAANLVREVDGKVVVQNGVVQSAETKHQQFAAHHCLQNNKILAAAHHFLRAGEQKRAAKLLVEYQDSLLAQSKIDSLYPLLKQLDLGRLNAQERGQLMLLRGHVLVWRADVENAKQAFQMALSSAEIPLRAQAYFALANLLSRSDIDAALIQFERCIQLLANNLDWQQLVAEAHLRRANIYLQDRRDVLQAEQDLTTAQTILEQYPNEHALRSDLHKARTIQYRRQRDGELSRRHAWLAWQAAHEAQSAERIMETAHNLGVAYAETQQFEQALTYFQESYELSGSHHQSRGLCAKHIGGCHYELGNPDAATVYYERAYECFVEMGLKTYQAYVCYDLAEVLVEQRQSEAAYRYYKEGRQLSMKLEMRQLVELFRQMAGKWDEFSAELSPRHRQILTYVREHGSINKKECMALIDLKERQATRTLKDELGKKLDLLQSIGKGRATRYVLRSA